MAVAAKMQRAYDRLCQAAARLEAMRRPGYGDAASRLAVEPSDGGLLVHWLLNEDALFVPEDGEEIFSEIYRLLGSAEVAPWLASLTLEGHQIATNGTIDWEVRPLAHARSLFSRLKVFRLDSVGTDTGEPCYAGSLQGREGGPEVATRLLDRMPAVEELAIPEPPGDEGFFHGPPHPLRRLSVFRADYDSFVMRLASAERFPHLEEVHFTESFRTDVDPRLPISHYARLLQSSALPSLRAVTLGQVDVTSEQAALLRGTRVGRQLCRLTVRPVQSWCDRPIMYAPA